MSRKREAVFMGIGILTGITLCGPAAQAATKAITATLSNQPIYVNDQKVEFEAYMIHGNNFVQLRDIAQAVDFGATYDVVTNSVHIDPDAPYQEEAKQNEPSQTSPTHLRRKASKPPSGRSGTSAPPTAVMETSIARTATAPLRHGPHSLRGLGYPVFQRRLWQPALA